MSWRAIDPQRQILTARYRFPGGVSRTTIVTWGDSALVYSPGDGLARELPAALATTRGSGVFLLSPSISHTLGVAPWKEALPEARVITSAAAIPRLRRKTGLKAVEPLEALEVALPNHISLHRFERCKTQELWVQIDQDDTVYSLVCDGFTNIDQLPSNPLIRLMMLAYGLRTGLRVTPIFRLNIKDKPSYRKWVSDQFPVSRRHTIIPCHGEVDDAPNLGERIASLVAKRF